MGHVVAELKVPEHKADEGRLTIPISSPMLCDHVTTVCIECKSSWENDHNMLYDATAEGRRLHGRDGRSR